MVDTRATWHGFAAVLGVMAQAEVPDDMKISSLGNWFGGNRMQAERVGRELGPLAWAGVGFAGGIPELAYIDTSSGVAVDLHRHIINLATVVADDRLLKRMMRLLDRLLFHPDVLAAAQRRCRDREIAGTYGVGVAVDGPDVEWAADFFVCCWMGRGGVPGQKGELSQKLSIRWTTTGGSSAKRWRSALESLPAWNNVIARWQFVCMDIFDMLTNLKPQTRAGLYFDPPWVEEGLRYKYPFTVAMHRRLAAECRRLSGYRIVLRYGDHPLIRELYPPTEWRYIESTTSSQQRSEVREVLIVNGPEIGGAT